MNRRVDELELRAIVAIGFDIRQHTADELLIRAFRSAAEVVRILMGDAP